MRKSNSNIDILNEAIIEAGLSDTYNIDEINSFQQWKSLGFKVKKGEKAKLKIELWYPSKYKKDNNEEETKFYLKTTALFTKDQVEPLNTK